MVTYFVNNGLVSHIRVVDKTPPFLAWLNNQHTTAFNDKAVEFYSANLINQGNCQNNVYISFALISLKMLSQIEMKLKKEKKQIDYINIKKQYRKKIYEHINVKMHKQNKTNE